jgi:hypothetical protein
MEKFKEILIWRSLSSSQMTRWRSAKSCESQSPPLSIRNATCEELSDGEDAVEVQGQDSSPGGGWIFMVRGAPVRAGVVDQDMKFCRADGFCVSNRIN